MENRNLLIATIFVVMTVLMLVPLVSAAAVSVTWNDAAGISNYSNQTTSFTYNCTTSAHNVINVTVYANSSAGVMNPLESFANLTSPAQTAWTGTVDIQSADDGTAQNISCYAQNATVGAYSLEISCHDVMLDSTDPVCNVSVLHPSIAYKGNQKITYYSSDAIEWVSTSLTIDGPGKQTTITATAQNGPIDLGSNDTKYTGDWALAMTVTDRAGNTCTDSATFKSYMPDGLGLGEEPDKADNRTILIVVVLALLAWMFFGKKKQ